MNHRKLSILAAAVTLALAASAGAQTATDPRTQQSLIIPPVTTPPDTTLPVGTQPDPFNRTTTSPTTPQPQHDAELEQPPLAREEQVFDQLDGSGDGYIARTDLPSESSLRQQFDLWDVDKDGRMSRQEFSVWVGHQSAEQVAMLIDHDALETASAAPTGTLGSADSTIEDIEEMDVIAARREHRSFQELDSSGDGFLHRSDLLVGTDLSDRFDQFDSDADGRLSRTEFEQWVAARDREDDEFDAMVGQDFDDGFVDYDDPRR